MTLARAPSQAALLRAAKVAAAEGVCLTPRDLARIVREAVASGKPVKVDPDGTVVFNMPVPTVADGFDMVDFSKGGR